uniref:Uncharacterized protein n=1 Tax=Hyaloperonospora arabidopsidis (strain Emoy2) TaxID=559515 RepID=M4BRY9_HYAAE
MTVLSHALFDSNVSKPKGMKLQLVLRPRLPSTVVRARLTGRARGKWQHTPRNASLLRQEQQASRMVRLQGVKCNAFV